MTSTPQSLLSTAYPSTPDPTLVALVLPLVRWVLTLGSAVGFIHGTTSDSVVYVVASCVVGVGTAGWALYSSVKNRQHAHDVAVLNAARPAGSIPLQPPRALLAQ